MCAERAIGGVAKIPRSQVTSGTDPGLDIPLAGSPSGGIGQARLRVFSGKREGYLKR
jgi:hypothetical protein